jgi:hypothetical protein
MTDSILIHSIDLNTCSVDDTSFNLEFAMVAKEGGFVNAFVLYFKVILKLILRVEPHKFQVLAQSRKNFQPGTSDVQA